jgi:hypothetical protein
MKTLLFGLATAAAACASPPQPSPQYPLCDREGAPACGNIGQVGRASRAPVITEDANAVFAAKPADPLAAKRAATAFVTTVAATAQHVIPKITRVLVGASREITTVTPFSAPLVDHREQVVCGNVMSKGGSRRICRNADGDVISTSYYNDDEE